MQCTGNGVKVVSVPLTHGQPCCVGPHPKVRGTTVN